MPTDDQQVLVAGVASAPASFTIPGNGQIRPKSVFATYDGTGAASSFVPALKVISDAGKVVGIYVSSTSIAAGGSADVSWFPRVGFGIGNVLPGQMISTYTGKATAADFTWTGPAGGNVSSGYPSNSSWTKFLDQSSIIIIAEGDFTPGAAEDLLTMGLFIDGNNEINVASATLGGYGFSSVQLARILPPNAAGTGPIPAGVHTLDMQVSSATGQTTTFRCHSATDLNIIEYIPAALQ